MQHPQHDREENRSEQEPIDFLTVVQQKGSGADQSHPDGVYTLGDKEVPQLDCLAFVRQGQIIPLFDLKGLPMPDSPEGKVYFSALTIQHIIGGVLDALEQMYMPGTSK